MKRLTILCLLLLVGAAFAVDFDLIKESRIDMNPVTAVGSDGQIVYAGVGAALNIYNIYQKDFPQLVGTIEGHSSKIKGIRVEGDLLWVLWEKEGLEAFDITDRYDPRFVGRFPKARDDRFKRFTSMDIDGDAAFIGGADFIASLDISDPASPKLSNYATLNGAPLKIDYYNNRLYLAAGRLGLAALFVPNPSQFFLMGVQKGIYTTVKAFGSRIIYGRLDEAKPNEPTIFSKRLFNIPFRSPEVVKIRDRYLFAGGLANFSIYRMSEQSDDPKMIWDLPEMPTLDCAIRGDVIYLANSHKGLSAFDILDPEHPMEIGRLSTHDFPRRACLYDVKLYVAAGVSGVLVYDVANPAYPRLVDTLAIDRLELAWDVEQHGESIYILGARESAAENVFVEQYRLDGEWLAEYPIAHVGKLDPIGEIAFGEGYCAVSLGESGISICDFRDGRISPLYSIENRSIQFCDMEFHNKNLIVSDYHGGYHILELGNGIPRTIGQIKTSDEGGNGIAIAGDYLLAADGPQGLAVIDISDPTNPTLANRYPTKWATDIVIDGERAFLADGQGALKAFDISDLPNLSLATQLPDGGYWTQAIVADDNLYGIDRYFGVYIYEIRERAVAKKPTAKPVEVALLDAYPNPFNARASISFQLPERAATDLSIYDILGRKVVTLIRDTMPKGKYTLTWRAEDFPSGTYFAVLQTGKERIEQKLLLIK